MTSGPLGVGQRAPDFVAPGQAGGHVRFYAHAGGRPTVVVFHGGTDPARLTALAGQVGPRDDAALCCIGQTAPEVPAFADPDGTIATSYGITGDRLTAVVLDPNLRVVGVVSGEDVVDQAVALLDRAVHRGPAVQVSAQAPVLLLPDALPAQWCERLIQLWHTEGGVDTGVARGSGEVLDDRYKRRRDHTVRDPELVRELSSVVGSRVMPEVRKAFAYRATRFEGFKIACYDASTGGFFRPHRDNVTQATAHRVFALTLNLNSDYEGGELRFPEYGNQLYRPDPGAALVFSCAHLHEVREVTRGRRFVLLSFLFHQPDR